MRTKQIILIFFAFEIIFACGLGDNLKAGADPGNQIISTSETYDLNYGKAHALYFRADPSDHVDWSFESSNPLVGIRFWVMPQAEWDKWAKEEDYDYTSLSNGSYYKDNGTWVPPSDDNWYFVFVNNDLDMKNVTLTYSVVPDYIHPTPWWNNLIYIAIIVPVSIIGAIQTRKRRKARREFIAQKAAQGGTPILVTQAPVSEPTTPALAMPTPPTAVVQPKVARSTTIDPAQLEKLQKLVQVSKRLKISQIVQILNLEETALYGHIVDWAAEFGFMIDEDILDFGTGRKDDFIAALTKAYAAAPEVLSRSSTGIQSPVETGTKPAEQPAPAPQICPKCGAPRSPESNKCESCGNPL